MRDLSFDALFGGRYSGADIPDNHARQMANTKRDTAMRSFQGAVELDELAQQNAKVAVAVARFEALGFGKPALAKWNQGSAAIVGLVFPEQRIPDPLQPGKRPGVVSPKTRRTVALDLRPAKRFIDHPEDAVSEASGKQEFLGNELLEEYFDRTM